MQVLGNKKVFENYIRQQRALEKGEKAPFRIAQVFLGGGMAGARGAGMAQAIAEFAADAPDVCAGVSVGSIIQFAFMSGRARLARAIFGSLTWNGFIKGRPWNPKMEIEQLMRTVREIGAREMLKHRADFIAYTTEFNTGNGLAIKVKQTDDPIKAVQASIMIPGLCSGVVDLDGKEVVDGACGTPFPVRDIVKKYRPTDILIVFNRPLPERSGWIEWHLFPWLARLYLKLHGVPQSLRERTALMDRVMADEIQMLTRRKAASRSEFFWGLFLKSERPPPRERKQIRWCIVAPDPDKVLEAIPQTCMDRDLVLGAFDEGYWQMKLLFQEAENNMK